MRKSVLLGLVLVALIDIQLVNSLTCYSCESEASCRQHSSQVCSNATVSANMAFLKTVFTNMSTIIGSTQYTCANLTYSFYRFQGCVDKSTNICSTASINPQLKTNMTCTTCNWNYCNPAGVHSRSTDTIIATAVALIIFKATL